MPSKTTFALLAALAASAVSALPVGGYGNVDLYERDGPTAPAAAVPDAAPPAVAAAQISDQTQAKPVVGPIQSGQEQVSKHPHQRGHRRRHSQNGVTDAEHPHHRGHHSQDGVTEGEVHHPRRRHTHHGTTSHSGDAEHDIHHSHHPKQGAQQLNAAVASSNTPPTPPTLQSDPTQNVRRELDERGFLEAIGLKARVADLTIKQTEQMNKAKSICDSLSSKKDKKKCHKRVEKIIQLTKERNYVVKEFIDETNHHDVFKNSDPTLSSSTSSSSTSSPSSPTS